MMESFEFAEIIKIPLGGVGDGGFALEVRGLWEVYERSQRRQRTGSQQHMRQEEEMGVRSNAMVKD